MLPSSCGPPIEVILSHCRLTLKMEWIAEKTRRPSFWKKFFRLSKMNGASGVWVSMIEISYWPPCVLPVVWVSASVGFRDDDVDAGKAPVELVRGRHRADDEPEVLPDAGGDRLRREPQRHRVGHLRVDDRRERQQEVAVLGRRLASPGSTGSRRGRTCAGRGRL